MSDKESYLADEELLLADSGEIPEVAYHASLHFLSTDPEGPGLTLEEADHSRLMAQVVGRYRWIILRDLDPENRDRRIYRGVARSAANWWRLAKFCRNRGLSAEAVRGEAAAALRLFLARELADTASGRTSSVNCSVATLEAYARGVGLSAADLPSGWQQLCPVDPAQPRFPRILSAEGG